jgi:hypothetical protein
VAASPGRQALSAQEPLELAPQILQHSILPAPVARAARELLVHPRRSGPGRCSGDSARASPTTTRSARTGRFSAGRRPRPTPRVSRPSPRATVTHQRATTGSATTGRRRRHRHAALSQPPAPHRPGEGEQGPPRGPAGRRSRRAALSAEGEILRQLVLDPRRKYQPLG